MSDPSLEGLNATDRALLLAGRKLFQHPEVASQAKRLLMKADPSAKFADIEAEDRASAQVTQASKEANERIEKLENDIRERTIKENRQRMTDSLKGRGLDIVAVEKIMTDKKINSYETAAEFLLNQSQVAAPTPHDIQSSRPSMPTGKELWRNPTNFARDEAYNAINDLRSNKVRVA